MLTIRSRRGLRCLGIDGTVLKRRSPGVSGRSAAPTGHPRRSAGQRAISQGWTSSYCRTSFTSASSVRPGRSRGRRFASAACQPNGPQAFLTHALHHPPTATCLPAKSGQPPNGSLPLALVQLAGAAGLRRGVLRILRRVHLGRVALVAQRDCLCVGFFELRTAGLSDRPRGSGERGAGSADLQHECAAVGLVHGGFLVVVNRKNIRNRGSASL
jgi:hypothetical protein